MQGFEDANSLMEFCERVWRQDVDPEVLRELATSNYGLGDLGLNEIEVMEDEGFLIEFFQSHADIYDVLGELRVNFAAGFPLFRVIAATHPATPQAALASLASDPDPEVVWALGGNTQAGDALLSALARSDEVLATGIEALADPWPDDQSASGIRFGTGNPWELENVPVATSVAGNRSCTSDLLDYLCASQHPDLSKAVVLRNGERLSDGQWADLLAGAMRRDRQDGGWLQWIAVSSHTPSPLFESILRQPQEGQLLARRLATSPASSAEELSLVLEHVDDAWTRAKIAHHSNVSVALLTTLSVDTNAEVRRAVSTSPVAPDEIRASAALSL